MHSDGRYGGLWPSLKSMCLPAARTTLLFIGRWVATIRLSREM